VLEVSNSISVFREEVSHVESSCVCGGKRKRVQQTEGDNQSHAGKKKDGAQMGQREP